MTAAGPVTGWIGLDVPVEVLAAVGTPVRIEAAAGSPAPLAAAFGEGGGHPWMRAVVDRLLSASASFERVVIGATPVTGVWLYNFLLTLERGPGAPALPALELVNLSHDDRPSASKLNRDSIAGLAARLGATEDGLSAAIRERNAVRALQRRIDGLRHGSQATLSGAQARRLLDAADQLPVAAYVALAQQALAEASSAPRVALTPVIYSGPGSPSLDLYLALEGQGLSVVADDADMGTRAIGPDVDEALPPIEALAIRYANRSPAPAGWTTRQRIDWLTALVNRTGAEAVVFDLPAWSHPPAWDFPAERRALKAIGIACILAPQAAPAEAAAEIFRSLQAGRRAHV
jgi:hypothetical protein